MSDDADTFKALKSFKADKPPDFSKLVPFEGRKGEELSLPDRVQLRVMSILNPGKAPKLEKMMGKVKLAVKTPRLDYKSVGERDEESELPDTVQIGDQEYSRNFVLYRVGLGAKLKAQERQRRAENDSLYPDFLGRLRAIDKTKEPYIEERERGADPLPAKHGAEGGSVDTAAYDAGLYSMRNLRDSLNIGRKLPQQKLKEKNDHKTEVKQITKEALQTFFLAGLLKTANDTLLNILSTPEGVAAFMQGFMKRAEKALAELGAGQKVLRKADIPMPAHIQVQPRQAPVVESRPAPMLNGQPMMLNRAQNTGGFIHTPEGKDWSLASRVKQLINQPSPSLS